MSEDKYKGIISASDKVIAEAWVDHLGVQIAEIMHSAMTTAVGAALGRANIAGHVYDISVNSEKILKLLKRWDKEGMPSQSVDSGVMSMLEVCDSISSMTVRKDSKVSLPGLDARLRAADVKTSYEVEQDRLRAIAKQANLGKVWSDVYASVFAEKQKNVTYSEAAFVAVDSANAAVKNLEGWMNA